MDLSAVSNPCLPFPSHGYTQERRGRLIERCRACPACSKTGCQPKAQAGL